MAYPNFTHQLMRVGPEMSWFSWSWCTITVYFIPSNWCAITQIRILSGCSMDVVYNIAMIKFILIIIYLPIWYYIVLYHFRRCLKMKGHNKPRFPGDSCHRSSHGDVVEKKGALQVDRQKRRTSLSSFGSVPIDSSIHICRQQFITFESQQRE